MNGKQKRITVICSAVALFVAAVHSTFAFLPYKELDYFISRDFSTRVYDRKNNLIQITPLQNGLRREYVSVSEMPDEIIKTVVREEDRRFYLHYGIDPFAILRAVIQNSKNHKNVSGASTITMQLAKIISLNYQNQQNDYTNEINRSIKQKISEAFCAIKLEARFTKKEILELYLNGIPFGNNVEGIQSASRLYFSKEVSKLSKEEMETLARIPRRPSFYSPEKKYVYPFYMPHLVNYLKDNNFFDMKESKKSKVYNSKLPYEVHLSVDMDVQHFAQTTANRALDEATDSRISNVSVLVMDVENGNVLAWVGSNDFFSEKGSGQIDGVRFKNQPGSSMKPFLYALALEEGIVVPTQVMPDVPMEFGEDKAYIPLNFNNRFNGPVRLRSCLASSLNVPAVDLLQRLGIEKYAHKLDELMFEDILKVYEQVWLGLALGAAPVSLKDFVPAFAVFADDGWYKPLNYFSDNHQNKKHIERKRIYSSDTARIIDSFLSEKNARALGFGYNQTFETKYPSIFKTGTSNQYQNITALGATPRYAVGVWMGNFSGETVVGKTGSSLPAWVAKKVLDYLEDFDGKENLSFPEPSGYEKKEICSLSGMKPGKNCKTTVFEYVKKGRELPYCSWHQSEKGKETIVYPQEYQRWILLNQKVYDENQRHIDYGKNHLKIIAPRNDSVFYEDSSAIAKQSIRFEAGGGYKDELEIYIDGLFYEKLRRPFVTELPLKKGKHIIKALCDNQENIVFYEVK